MILSKFPEAYEPAGVVGIHDVMKDYIAVMGTCKQLREIVMTRGIHEFAAKVEVPELNEIKDLKDPELLVTNPSSLPIKTLQDAAKVLGIQHPGRSKDGNCFQFVVIF